MTKEQFYKAVNGKTPTYMKKVLARQSYYSLEELWTELTRNEIDVSKTLDGYKAKVKSELKNFFALDIYRFMMKNYYEQNPENDS